MLFDLLSKLSVQHQTLTLSPYGAYGRAATLNFVSPLEPRPPSLLLVPKMPSMIKCNVDGATFHNNSIMGYNMCFRDSLGLIR